MSQHPRRCLPRTAPRDRVTELLGVPGPGKSCALRRQRRHPPSAPAAPGQTRTCLEQTSPLKTVCLQTVDSFWGSVELVRLRAVVIHHLQLLLAGWEAKPPALQVMPSRALPLVPALRCGAGTAAPTAGPEPTGSSRGSLPVPRRRGGREAAAGGPRPVSEHEGLSARGSALLSGPVLPKAPSEVPVT